MAFCGGREMGFSRGARYTDRHWRTIMSIFRIARPALLGLWFLPVLAPSAAAQDPARIIQVIEERQTPNRQGLDPFTLRELMERFHVPGLSVAVIRDFKIDWAKAWGMADADTAAPVNTDT